jgi:hypothetical protein
MALAESEKQQGEVLRNRDLFVKWRAFLYTVISA